MESKELLNRNKVLIGEIRELAVKQEKLVYDDKIDEFLELSNLRERIKKEVTRNNKRYSSFMKGKPRKNIFENESMAMEISEVIQSIQEVDRRVERLLKEKKGNLVHNVKKIRRGKNAVKGYGAKPLSMPKFVSRKG